MKQPGLLKPNDDPEMQPFVVHNVGGLAVQFTSILETARPDLEEYEEHLVFTVHPGRRVIVPHGYFRTDVLGKGTTNLVHHFGTAAPELRGYRRGYKMRLAGRPWYRKLTDIIGRF